MQVGIKTNHHSLDNYGLMNPVKIATKKFEQGLSVCLTNS